MPRVIRSAQPMPMTLWSSMYQADPPACELPFLIALLACFARMFRRSRFANSPLIGESITGGYNSPPLMAMTYHAEGPTIARGTFP